MVKQRRKLFKVFGGLALALVGILVLIVIVGVIAIDTVARRAIETGGSYATGVPTTVESADVGIMAGTFRMTGFQIGNPEGFSSPHFWGMGESRVGLSVGSLGQETIRLPELTLNRIEVYLEGAGDGANYNQILNNLKRFESKDQPKADPEQGGSGKSFVVDVLTIDGVEVNVAGIPGVAQAVGDVTVTVPRIELRNVGKQGGDGDGLSMAGLINVIVKTVMSATIEAGGGVIPPGVLDDLGNQLAELESLGAMGITAVGDVGDIAGELSKQAGEAVEGAAKEAEKAVDDVKKGIEDLIGGGNPDQNKDKDDK